MTERGVGLEEERQTWKVAELLASYGCIIGANPSAFMEPAQEVVALMRAAVVEECAKVVEAYDGAAVRDAVKELRALAVRAEEE